MTICTSDGIIRFYHNKVQFLQICKYRIRIHGVPKVTSLLEASVVVVGCW